MEDLVNIINDLQEVVTLLGHDILDLPQIVVVGDQSSGKSSVLESLVGQYFLPRGTGITTRRPLILQLVRQQEVCRRDVDCGVFLHDKDRVYTDFGEIRQEIITETVRKAGPLKDINSEPIILKIFSKNVSTLTMVDLPGIVKIPVGDQPPNIEEMVKALILKYISNSNSIILAVVPANADMATCESLKMAKEVDPCFDRTVAVVTKLDLMDIGTNALDILNGDVIPVKLGIIGVVNRSHLHTMEGKSMRDAVLDEEHYLRSVYPTIANKHGIPSLARTLQKILLSHIESCLPQLRQRVRSSILHCEKVLGSFGSAVEDPNKMLLEILTEFSTTYCNKISGTHSDLDTNELTGGARISYIFLETYGKTLDRIDPLDGLTRSSIITAIKNTTGIRPPLFIPEVCFEILVRKQIVKLETPSLACVQLINDELERIITEVGPQLNVTMSRFPNLHKKMKSVTLDLIKTRVEETNKMVKQLVRIHSAYINTTHPEFARDKTKILTEMKRETFKTDRGDNSANDDSNNMNSDVDLVGMLITSYFNVVKRSVQDTVPKAIMHLLVNKVMNRLFRALISELYSKETCNILFEESQSITDQRKNLTELLKSYSKADKVIGNLRSTIHS